MNRKTVITIARQFGSGGREIGKKLAQELDIPFYDKDLIILAAKESGMSPEVFENIDETAANSLLYTLAMGAYSMGSRMPGNYEMPMNDKLFLIQSDMIKKFAMEGGCVIIGRCADYILRNNPKAANVFIHASMSDRIKRIGALYQLDEKRAEELIKKTDKKRAAYFNHYSGKKWGNVDEYHIAIDSSALGVDNAVDLLADFARMRERMI